MGEISRGEKDGDRQLLKEEARRLSAAWFEPRDSRLSFQVLE